MDFGDRSMAGIGEIVRGDGSVRGGVFEEPATSRPGITVGELPGISMRDAPLASPPIVGGTIEAPAMPRASIDRATMTGSELS